MMPSKKSVSDPSTGIGYNVRYEHEVHINQEGVPMPYIDWCGQHCKGKWGWHFVKINQIEHPDGSINTLRETAVVSFEHDKDAFWFALTHLQG